MSAPVVVTGEQGVQGTLTPEAIAGVLTFRADPSGLVPEINIQAVDRGARPAAGRVRDPRPRRRRWTSPSGRPVVIPSKDGRGVDYEATLKDLLTVLTGTGERTITAVYADQPAELTTEELNKLGITGVIGEFTTRGFAPDSGKNIRRAAQVINGMIVEPGETFSLNGATEPRNASNGYVEAGIISDGHASRGVGGGVSQVATTLYNAAYFAGMVDVEHKEHSFYISRYPPGREATVFDDTIDLKFRNDNPTGVMIQTAWTPESITVRLFGTKRYEVTSTPGPRTKPDRAGEGVHPGGRAVRARATARPGFTVTDTRTLREISTGQVRTETRTVQVQPVADRRVRGRRLTDLRPRRAISPDGSRPFRDLAPGSYSRSINGDGSGSVHADRGHTAEQGQLGGDGGAAATLADLIGELARHNVGALPVVDDDGRLVGIVSERDVVRQLHPHGAGRARRCRRRLHDHRASPPARPRQGRRPGPGDDRPAGSGTCRSWSTGRWPASSASATW